MKKISKIQLENFRAYYDRLTFSLDKGENLLLYGENGSGKTSLYKALDSFVQSFYAPVGYTPNRYKPAGAAGEIVLTIGDYDDTNKSVDNEVDYRLAEGVDNTQVAGTPFFKSLALSKGFLNYRDLLKVYLYEEKDPNLFDIFVNHLLGNHVPLAQGLRIELKKEWEQLNKDLFEPRTRNTNRHRKGKQRLIDFESVLRALLTNLFSVVNDYLSRYFVDFNMEIDYDLKPMTFNYARQKDRWKITQNLKLKIKLGNTAIAGYTDDLNEARLSAMAICLYLGALKLNPGQDLRLMFLDDIFIGIDSTNRRPIMDILNNEFKDFQIVIATYDRSWYCMAKNYFSNQAKDRWKFYNLFSLIKTEAGKSFSVPVITEGQTAFDKAKEFLHSPSLMDLPAAANYFRKALEELINVPHLPKELFLSDDLSFVPGFKLTKHVTALANLFALVGENTQNIYDIESFLHPLIHPLSHYEEEAPIYRNELMEVERAYAGLRVQIEYFPKKCQLLFGYGCKLAIQYNTVDGLYRSNYYLYLEDNLWLYKDAVGQKKFTTCQCRTYYMEGWDHGTTLTPCKIPPGISKFTYSTLDDALQTIYNFEVNNLHHPVVAHNDYDIVFVVKGKNMQECIKVRRDALWAQM